MDIEVRRIPLKTDGTFEADPAAMGGCLRCGHYYDGRISAEFSTRHY